ncbi:DUF418 domain-containing protein [Dyella mobilis]|uniref:DUF418 domain-containing protein n=1 Tax=Dyella mobilis TaxID=1849582 RepID=A0ABS2KCC6_9GAMM|nr:DUF418 domain-containing protein [Dyella mobilis]MBM7128836.1 DUF418 domain-containing protein [Dyella mobilis]
MTTSDGSADVLGEVAKGRKEDIDAITNASGTGPVQEDERIVFIDALRGCALFGVLAANMRGFNLPLSLYDTSEKIFPARHDVWMQALLDAFVSGKAYTTFAFLFGLGFAIQMTRAQARSVSFPWFYLRRLGALALFGLVHGAVIWSGDILLPYALGGFFLFWFRKATPKAILILAIILWAISPLLVIGTWIAKHFHVAALHWLAGFDTSTPDLAKTRQVIDTYAHANLSSLVQENGHIWLAWLAPLIPIMAISSLPLFLAGLYVWRKGWVQALPERTATLRRVCAWTLPLGLAAQIACVVANHWLMPQHADSPWVLISTLANIASAPLASCGYATGLALLFYHPRWRSRVTWLAPMGRMALTNYLTQSVFFVSLYSGLITGLYGRVGPAWNMLAAVLFYVAQVRFSQWWFKHFRFGPVEWLWRGVTYLKWPVMRLA